MASSVFRRPAARWAVPAGVAAAVVAAAVTVPLVADADSDLPERSVAELLVALAEADKVPFAGTVVQSADVGLPEIPALAQTGPGGTRDLGSVALSLLTGSTSARIWYADDTRFRVAMQDEMAESDVIRDGDDLWFWSSDADTASHLRVPASSEGGADAAMSHPKPFGHGSATPSDLADLALGAISDTTEVDVDGTATVAGRAAYELVVSPKTDESLIGSVRLAVDAEKSVPLRVRVYDRDGGEPAVEVGFTSVTFDEPDASVFAFTPPAGATVEELDGAELADKPDRAELAAAMPTIVGEGWTSVAVLRGVDLGAVSEGMTDSPETQALLDGLMDELDPVSGPFGSGVALQSDLLSALLLDDGRLLVGAVSLEALEAAAADPAAAVDAVPGSAPPGSAPAP